MPASATPAPTVAVPQELVDEIRYLLAAVGDYCLSSPSPHRALDTLRELEAAAAAPPPPGVPDSLRAAILSLEEAEKRKAHLQTPDGVLTTLVINARDKAEAMALEYVRAHIAAHPAGQAGVPDSLRALSEGRLSRERGIVLTWDRDIAPALDRLEAIARRMGAPAGSRLIRWAADKLEEIGAQPAGQAGDAGVEDVRTILARLWCQAEGNNPDETISDAGHTVTDGTLCGLDKKAFVAIIEAERAILKATTPPGGPRYQYREIGEGEGWLDCGREFYEAAQSSPHLDTRKVTPVPAATPGVPDSLRKEVTLADANAAILMDRARNGGWVDLFSLNRSEMSAAWSCLDWVRNLIAAQPAGQAGDAGAETPRGVIGPIPRPTKDQRDYLDGLPTEANKFDPNMLVGSPGRYSAGAARQTITVPSPFLVDTPAPNSTRTGVANADDAEPLTSTDCVAHWEAEQKIAASDEALTSTDCVALWEAERKIAARTGAAETVKPDPIRLMKEALFACLAEGTHDRNYGGVLVADGKKAWLRFSVVDAETSAALAAGKPALAARPEAPSDAGWSFDMEAAPRDGTPLLCVEYDEPQKVVDLHWFRDGGTASSWRGSFGQLRRPIAWRRLPTPPSDPAPSGQAEG